MLAGQGKAWGGCQQAHLHTAQSLILDRLQDLKYSIGIWVSPRAVPAGQGKAWGQCKQTPSQKLLLGLFAQGSYINAWSGLLASKVVMQS